MRSLRRNNSGVGWVLGVAVLSILIMPVVYFPLDMAWDQVYYTITDSYTFTGSFASAITVVQVIISYLVPFGLLYTVAWAIIQAKARKYAP